MRDYKKLVVQHLKRGGMVKMMSRLVPIGRPMSHLTHSFSRMKVGNGTVHKKDLLEGGRIKKQHSVKPLKFRF